MIDSGIRTSIVSSSSNHIINFISSRSMLDMINFLFPLFLIGIFYI